SLDEKLFTEIDYKIYGFLCKQGFATVREVSKELKIPVSSVQSQIEKLCGADWLKQDGSSKKYHINLLRILNNSTNNLLKEYQNTRRKEEDFVLQTSNSLTEATTAANNHLINSMENLFSETDALGGNLVEETISQISKFENNRLRAFGSYRINLDSFMRGVKEDIFRNIRKNLGFTSTGEIIFKEASLDMPEMPSALYIADTINNSRKLIKRGFSDIESKTRQVFEKKREEFQINQNELISLLENDMKIIQNEKKEIFSSKTELFLSLVKRYQNQFEILYSANLVSIETAKNSLIDNFKQKKVLFKNELEQITNRLINKTKSTISDVLKKFIAFPELIKEDLESAKQEKSQKKIQKLGNILRKSNLGFVQDAKEIVQQIQVLLNSNEEFSQKQGNIITDIMKLKTTINGLVEGRNYGELRTGIENLNNFLENLENGYSHFTSHGMDIKKRLKSYSKRLEERLEKIENQESSIETTLSTSYDLQTTTIFQNVQLSLGNLLQNISNELLLINDGFEREIENQNQVILEEIENSF
ncbi:MAG: winged helix-turn-helix transcriptional regulator, partial [Candidatus Heimdallarchaeota archaeon]|nr:winged helix-turn-helix transcriptional regulator [Candidatus Heimdallarchaeota archaeon]